MMLQKVSVEADVEVESSRSRVNPTWRIELPECLATVSYSEGVLVIERDGAQLLLTKREVYALESIFQPEVVAALKTLIGGSQFQLRRGPRPSKSRDDDEC